MLKAIVTGKDGQPMLVIGLNFQNLDKFRAEPGHSIIKIEKEEIGLPMDLIIFSGETDLDCAEIRKRWDR